MGDWKGSGEERDNKAGGDVNSQIGSFSCFPEPATLDGWLRQRRECIRETRAPPQGWGNGGEGGRCSLAGVCGEGTPEGCKERNGPRKRATLGENEGKLHKLVISLPCLQPLGSGDSTGGGRWADSRGVCPLWVTKGAERRSPVGFEVGEGSWAKDCGFKFSLSSFLHRPPHCALAPSAVFPIFALGSIFPLFSLSLLALCLSCIFPFPSSLGDSCCDRVCLAAFSVVDTV